LPIALNSCYAIFTIKRDLTALSAAKRHDVRQQRLAPLVKKLHDWMRIDQAQISKHNPVCSQGDQ